MFLPQCARSPDTPRSGGGRRCDSLLPDYEGAAEVPDLLKGITEGCVEGGDHQTSGGAASRLKPKMMRTAASLTFLTVYSDGGVHAWPSASTVATQDRIIAGSLPHKILLPHSIVSGLSVTSRSVTFGRPKIAHSS